MVGYIRTDLDKPKSEYRHLRGESPRDFVLVVQCSGRSGCSDVQVVVTRRMIRFLFNRSDRRRELCRIRNDRLTWEQFLPSLCPENVVGMPVSWVP